MTTDSQEPLPDNEDELFVAFVDGPDEDTTFTAKGDYKLVRKRVSELGHTRSEWTVTRCRDGEEVGQVSDMYVAHPFITYERQDNP